MHRIGTGLSVAETMPCAAHAPRLAASGALLALDSAFLCV